MFQAIRREMLARLFDATVFFRATAMTDGSPLSAVSKGLAFVQMYAVYEFTVCGAVQAAISSINGLPIAKIRPEMLGIVLDSELTAVADTANSKNKWDRRTKLFQKAISEEKAVANTAIIPGTGAHFTHAHLQVIWSVFGITEPTVPEPRLIGLIDFELTERRHAISHGRATAQDIGRQYTAEAISKKLADTELLCLHILQVMEAHCADETNICRKGDPV